MLCRLGEAYVDYRLRQQGWRGREKAAASEEGSVTDTVRALSEGRGAWVTHTCAESQLCRV